MKCLLCGYRERVNDSTLLCAKCSEAGSDCLTSIRALVNDRDDEIDRLRAELEMERARLDHLIDEAQRPFQGNSDDTGVWLVFDDSVMTTDEIWRRTSAEEEWLIHEVVRDAIDKAMEEE